MVETTKSEFACTLAGIKTNHTYFDAAYDAIIITTATRENTILYANPAFCALSGYTKEEIIGQTPRILQGEQTDRAVLESLKEALSKGESFEGQTINYKKDGTTYTVKWNIIPIVSEEGNIEAYVSFQKDITEKVLAQKNAEEAHEKLEQAHNFIKKVTDQLPGMVYQYRLNPDGSSSFPFATQKILHVYEVSPQEAFDDASLVIQRIHPDDLERVMKSIAASSESLSQWNCDYRVILPSRGLRHLRGSANPEIMENGSVLWHGYIHDVTEKKLTSALLDEKNILLESLLDESPNLIIVKNEDHSYRYVNKALATLFGVQDAQALVGKRDEDFVHNADQVEGYIKSVNEAFENMGKSFAVTEEVTDPITNTVHYFQSVKKAFMTPDGQRNVLVIASEVTDICALNDAIRQSNEQLSYVLDATGEGVWDWDVLQQKVTHNTQWCTMLGLDASYKEHHERLYFSAIWSEDIPLVQEALQKAFESTKEFLCEYRMVKSDGSLIWVEDHGRVVSQDAFGKATRVVGSIKDITERKKMMLELELISQEAQAANKAKSDFLANMSHEIRTPLNAVMGLTELLMYDVTHPKHKEYLSKIYNSSQLLLTILNDILDHAKIESGKLIIESVPFIIEEMLENLSAMYVPHIEAKNLELFLEIDPSLPQRVMGDPTRITQVLGNLLSNAVKFTEKGTIRVSVNAYESEQELFLHFSVKDTGIGIEKRNSEELFKAFTQADASISRRYGGTGLGLSICKKLVEAMGGRMVLESTPGEGSTFSFTVSVQCESPYNALFYAPQTLHSKRVLVVDDQASAIEIMRRYLQQWDMEVHSAIHPHEAMQKLTNAVHAKKMYDIILVDWKMPDCNGVELSKYMCDALEQMGIEKMPLIIMVSAHMEEKLREEALMHSVSFDAILTKPITQSHLYNALTCKHAVEKEPEITKQHPSKEIFSHASVLVVEDSPFNQFVMQEILARQGIKTTVVENGKEAISSIQNEAFDVVFMDLHMPVMGGIEATQKIRLLKSSDALPIIAMTAAAMEEDKEACLQAGMNEHIAKPLDYKNVVSVLNRYIKKKLPTCNSTETRSIGSSHTEKVFERLGISEEKYLLIVRGFAKSYEDKVGHLRELIDNEKYQEAKFWLHTLKGISANFGFETLYGVCLSAEEMITRGETFDAHTVGMFEEVLSQTLDEIHAIGKPKEIERRLSQEESLSYIQLLRQHLVEKKFIALALKMDAYHALSLMIEETKVCKAIEKNVDAFAYDNALALLDTHVKGL